MTTERAQMHIHLPVLLDSLQMLKAEGTWTQYVTQRHVGVSENDVMHLLIVLPLLRDLFGIHKTKCSRESRSVCKTQKLKRFQTGRWELGSRWLWLERKLCNPGRPDCDIGKGTTPSHLCGKTNHKDKGLWTNSHRRQQERTHYENVLRGHFAVIRPPKAFIIQFWKRMKTFCSPPTIRF